VRAGASSRRRLAARRRRELALFCSAAVLSERLCVSMGTALGAPRSRAPVPCAVSCRLRRRERRRLLPPVIVLPPRVCVACCLERVCVRVRGVFKSTSAYLPTAQHTPSLLWLCTACRRPPSSNSSTPAFSFFYMYIYGKTLTLKLNSELIISLPLSPNLPHISISKHQL